MWLNKINGLRHLTRQSSLRQSSLRQSSLRQSSLQQSIKRLYSSKSTEMNVVQETAPKYDYETAKMYVVGSIGLGIMVYTMTSNTPFEYYLSKSLKNGILNGKYSSSIRRKVIILFHTVFGLNCINEVQSIIMSKYIKNNKDMLDFLSDYPIDFSVNNFKNSPFHERTCKCRNNNKNNNNNKKNSNNNTKQIDACECDVPILKRSIYVGILSYDFIREFGDQIDMEFYVLNNEKIIKYIPEDILEKYIINKYSPEKCQVILSSLSKIQKFSYQFIKKYNNEYLKLPVSSLQNCKYTQEEWLELFDNSSDMTKEYIIKGKLNNTPNTKKIVLSNIDLVSDIDSFDKFNFTQEELLHVIDANINNSQIIKLAVQKLYLINVIKLFNNTQNKVLLNSLYESHAHLLQSTVIMNVIDQIDENILLSKYPQSSLCKDVQQYILNKFMNDKAHRTNFLKTVHLDINSLQYLPTKLMTENDFKEFLFKNQHFKWQELTNLNHFNDKNEEGKNIIEILLSFYKFSKDENIPHDLIKEYPKLMFYSCHNVDMVCKQQCLKIMSKDDIIRTAKLMSPSDDNIKLFTNLLTGDDIIKNGMFKMDLLLIDKYDNGQLTVEQICNIIIYNTNVRNINGYHHNISYCTDFEKHIYANPHIFVKELLNEGLESANKFIENDKINKNIKIKIIDEMKK